ncbi:NADH:ubiquinone oxidoreductase [Bacillus cereus]|uniref:NADH:ubiquinone oxidoreductase n=1 Tax=Bacillus cereus TaxID=1396 RepID=UPI00197A8936|nr:NADH:ubiquinone oxidoreductase [Bacillus cereus]
MYQNSYGYQNPYRSPDSYEYQNPHRYQDPYRFPNHSYEYPYNYDNRAFADKIGKYHTLTKPLPLSEYNYTIPINTRIFIHNVAITNTGQELVTIVAPIQKGGNLVNETIKNIPASQL